jgi:hypothetical protein
MKDLKLNRHAAITFIGSYAQRTRILQRIFSDEICGRHVVELGHDLPPGQYQTQSLAQVKRSTCLELHSAWS